MIIVERWIDVDSVEAKQLEFYNKIKRSIKVGIEAGFITVDNAGCMWFKEIPLHAELDGKLVGLRSIAHAAN